MRDEDVRIYSSKTDKQSSDVSKILDDMREHRNNGNLTRARELGKALGKYEPDFEKLVSQRFLKPDIMYQLKVLFVFCAEANLQTGVYDPLLYTTAINAMYEEIQSTQEGFYKNISDGVAYSFYYSEMRKGGDVAANIGKAFAMLCSANGSESFAKTGAELYGVFSETVEKEIEKTGFVQI